MRWKGTPKQDQEQVTLIAPGPLESGLVRPAGAQVLFLNGSDRLDIVAFKWELSIELKTERFSISHFTFLIISHLSFTASRVG
jgi:hypothetical protein